MPFLTMMSRSQLKRLQEDIASGERVVLVAANDTGNGEGYIAPVSIDYKREPLKEGDIPSQLNEIHKAVNEVLYTVADKKYGKTTPSPEILRTDKVSGKSRTITFNVLKGEDEVIVMKESPSPLGGGNVHVTIGVEKEQNQCGVEVGPSNKERQLQRTVERLSKNNERRREHIVRLQKMVYERGKQIENLRGQVTALTGVVESPKSCVNPAFMH